MVSESESVSPVLSKVKFRHLELNFRGLMADIDVQTLTTERRDNQAWVEASNLEKKLREQIDISESEQSESEENIESKQKVDRVNLKNTFLSNEKNTNSNSKNLEVSSAQIALGGSKVGSLTNTKLKEIGKIDTASSLPNDITHKNDCNFEIPSSSLNQEKINIFATNNPIVNASRSELSTSKNYQKPLLEAKSNTIPQSSTILNQKPENHLEQTSLKLPTVSNTQKKLDLNSDLNTEGRSISSQKSSELNVPLLQKPSSLSQQIELSSKPIAFEQQNLGNSSDISLRNSQKTPSSNAVDKFKSNPTLPESNTRSELSSKNTTDNSNTPSTKNIEKSGVNIEAFPDNSSASKTLAQPKKNDVNLESANQENSFVIPDASIQIPKIRYCNPRGKPLNGPTPIIQITSCEGIEVGRNSDQVSQYGLSSDSWADIKSQEFPAHIWSDLQISEGELHISPYKLMSTPVKISKQAPSASPLTPRRLAIPMTNSPINKNSLNPQFWIDDNNTELQAWISSSSKSDFRPTNFSTDHDSNPFIPPIATSTPRAPQRLKKNVRLSLLNCAKYEELGAKLPDLDISDLPNFNSLTKKIANVQDLKYSPVSNCIDNDWSQLTFGMINSPEKLDDNSHPKRRSHVSCTFPQDLSLGFTSQLVAKDGVISNNIPVIISDENLDLHPNSGNNSDNESIKTVTPSFLRSQIDIDVSDLKPSTPLRELQARRAQELALGQSKAKPTELQSPEKSQDFDGSYVVGSVLDDGFSADGSILHTNPIPQWARPGDQLDQKIITMQSLDLDDFFGGFHPANLKELFGNKSLSFMSTPPPPPVIIPYTQMDSPFYSVNEYMIKPVQPPKPASVFQRVMSSNFSSKISSAPTTSIPSPSSKVLSFKSTKDTAKSTFKLPTKVPINPPGHNIPRNKVIIRPQVRPLTRVPSKLATQMPQKQVRRFEGATSLSNSRRKI